MEKKYEFMTFLYSSIALNKMTDQLDRAGAYVTAMTKFVGLYYPDENLPELMEKLKREYEQRG